MFFFSWGKTWWAIRLARIIDDLDHGEALAATLDRHLGRVMPWYCLAAISRAEKEGTRAGALPILARQMSRRVPLECRHPLTEMYSWAFVRQVPVVAICVTLPYLFHHIAPEFTVTAVLAQRLLPSGDGNRRIPLVAGLLADDGWRDFVASNPGLVQLRRRIQDYPEADLHTVAAQMTKAGRIPRSIRL